MLIKNTPNPSSISDAGKYLQVYLYPWLINISTCLRKLQFDDNFVTFRVQNISISSGQTVRINNDFKSRFPGGQVIPSGRVIFKQTGNGIVSDGTWTADTIEMINNGPSDVVVSIIFFR
jgi:hypothetical protein